VDLLGKEPHMQPRDLSGDHARIARRERINEIYRAFWDPVPKPGAGLPLVPDDHIRSMRIWLERGFALRQFPAAEPIIEANAELAYEYVLLLIEEALDRQHSESD
jgi:hypothetical protein